LKIVGDTAKKIQVRSMMLGRNERVIILNAGSHTNPLMLLCLGKVHYIALE